LLLVDIIDVVGECELAKLRTKVLSRLKFILSRDVKTVGMLEVVAKRCLLRVPFPIEVDQVVVSSRRGDNSLVVEPCMLGWGRIELGHIEVAHRLPAARLRIVVGWIFGCVTRAARFLLCVAEKCR